jgi:proteasome accessory factor C
MIGPDERLARLLSLLPWLRAHPGVAVATAAEQFGITEDQLRADVSLLWFCGLPGLAGGDLIDVEFEGDTVRVLDAQTLDRPLRLTADEGVALLAAARSLRELPGLVDVQALDRVISKLSGAVVGLSAEPQVAVRLGEHPQTDIDVLAAVREALIKHQRLRLRYLVERRDEMTDRVVDPLELRLMDGRAYLHAWDPAREGTRSFRLDRIESAVLLDQPAQVPDGARATLADSPVAPFSPQESDIPVVIELGRRARWVADYYPMETVEPSALGGPGDLRVTLRTPDPSWITRLMLRLGGAATVVSPGWLAAEVVTTATAGLAAYGAAERPSGS